MNVDDFLDGRAPVGVRNENGRSRIVLVCEHASNFVPEHLCGLGLPDAALQEHIAWDPGALGVSEILSDLLDAPLVHANVSRLVLDINRRPDHSGSIVTLSETFDIPGNRSLTAQERALRCEAVYKPFHAKLAGVVASRDEASWVVSMHSFTRVYKDVSRPWHVGILHDDDTRLSTPLLDALSRDPHLVVGDNEPYSPRDGVYHTIAHHTAPFGYAGAMVEIRNDLIRNVEGQAAWARRFHAVLTAIDPATVVGAAEQLCVT